MSTERNLTPEGFRTAAYLEARARMDFRRGKRGPVHCTPGNKKCGNRCIPNEWDCRMKGEGNDPHLKARRFDPVSGIANLERGTKRVGKFLRTGSFSELESGKRSLIRGAVKLKPGDLKQQEEFKTWLEQNYLKIAVPIFIVGLGISAHSILKANNTFGYRDNQGKKVDDAVREGIGKVLDVVPGLGKARAYTRQQASAAMEANIRRSRQFGARKRALESDLSSYIGSTTISPTLIKGNSDLTKALKVVNDRKKDITFYEWNTAHRQAFWGATHSDKHLDSESKFLTGKSIFAEPTAQAHLNAEWKLNLGNNAPRSAYVSAITNRLASERDAYIQLAKQRGFRVLGTPGNQKIHADDMDAFITDTVKDLADEKRRTAQGEFIRVLTEGGSDRIKANHIYRRNVEGFDTYYKEVAKSIQRVAGAPDYDQDMVAEGLVSIRAAAERRRIDYLLATSKKPRKSSAGPAHDKLFLRDYYHTRVAGNPSSKYQISADEAVRVASELTGNTVSNPNEAIELLNKHHGFKGAELEQRRNPFVRSTPKAGEGRAARRRRIPDAQIIKDRMKAGYSREEAEAYLQRLKEQRGDEDDTGLSPRVRAYLETQARLDKRCGKSGIPEGRKCTKTTVPQSEEARNRARGAVQPGVTCNPPNQKCGNLCIPPTATCHLKGGGGMGSNLAKGALAVGAVAGVALAGRHAYKTRHSNKLYTSAANHVSKGIQAMSTKQVRDGIAKLPKQWQAPANKLVGKAKVGLAYVSADMQGMKIKHIDNENNFSTWHDDRTGSVLSIGAVDDTLVTFVSERKGNAGAFPKYGVAFQTDLSFSQKEGVSKAQSLAVSKQVKSMFQNQLDQIPENAVLFNKPFKDDGLGDKRKAIYKRFKFREIRGIRGGEMYALKNQGKLTAIPVEQEDYIAELIKGGDAKEAAERYQNRRRDSFDNKRLDYTPKNERKGKPCGKSFIGKNEKCTEKTTAQYSDKVKNNLLLAAGAVAVGVTAAALVGSRRRRTASKGLSPKAAAGIASRTAERMAANPPTMKRREPGASRTSTRNVTQTQIDNASAVFWDPSTKAPQPKEARPIPEHLKPMAEMGFIPGQRTYTENAKYDIHFSNYATAVKRAGTKEAEKFANLISKGQIRTNGKVADLMHEVLDPTAMPPELIRGLDMLERSVRSDSEYVTFAGFVLTPEHIKRQHKNFDFANPHKNKAHTIFLNHTREKLNLTPERGMINDQLLRGRAAIKKLRSMPSPPAEKMQSKEYIRDGIDAMTASGTLTGSNLDTINYTHEAMHVIDIHMNKAARPLTSKQRTDLKAEAEKYGISQYGMQDVDGAMNEFIAESAVYYVWDSKNLKKEAPSIYALIDGILDSASSNFSS